MSNSKTNNKSLILFSICALAALLVVVFFIKYRNISQITSFEECAKAGYPIMESYPEQCRTPSGVTFTRQVPVESNLQTQTVEEISLTFKYPKDLVYRKEIADNDGQIRTAGFFLTKGSETAPEYQMYGLYEQYRDAKLSDLELLKKEMDPKSIKDVTLGGYKGIEGLILGQKTRYVTIILKDNKLFSVSTMPPTLENKAQSEKILATFNFR
jgi:hypothetical protein